MSASRVAVTMARNKTLVFHHTIKKTWLIDVGEIGGLNTKAEEPEPVICRVEIDDPYCLGRCRYHIAECNVVVSVCAIPIEPELRI